MLVAAVLIDLLVDPNLMTFPVYVEATGSCDSFALAF
jgi:hypothetical protein